MSRPRLPFEKTEKGVVFKVKVEPRSSRRMVAGLHGDALKIKLTSAPVEGKANEELIEFLSELLNVKKSAVKILQGQSSKQKVIEIAGLKELSL